LFHDDETTQRLASELLRFGEMYSAIRNARSSRPKTESMDDEREALVDSFGFLKGIVSVSATDS
jgi:hypothetical protein